MVGAQPAAPPRAQPDIQGLLKAFFDIEKAHELFRQYEEVHNRGAQPGREEAEASHHGPFR